MIHQPWSRRRLMQHGVELSIGLLLVRSGATAAAEATVCADPELMDSGQASMRSSVHYTEVAADQSKTCAQCAFFQAGANHCGTCQILAGPANVKGWCESWSPKG